MRSSVTLEFLQERHAWITQVYSEGTIDAYLFTKLVAHYLTQITEFVAHSSLSADKIIPLLLKLKEFLLEAAGDQSPSTRRCDGLFNVVQRIDENSSPTPELRTSSILVASN